MPPQAKYIFLFALQNLNVFKSQNDPENIFHSHFARKDCSMYLGSFPALMFPRNMHVLFTSNTEIRNLMDVTATVGQCADYVLYLDGMDTYIPHLTTSNLVRETSERKKAIFGTVKNDSPSPSSLYLLLSLLL